MRKKKRRRDEGRSTEGDEGKRGRKLIKNACGGHVTR
jgi:hypothetical protein